MLAKYTYRLEWNYLVSNGTNLKRNSKIYYCINIILSSMFFQCNCVMMIEIQTIEGGWKRCLLTRGDYIKKYLINFFCRYFNVGAWIIRYWTGPLLYNEGYKIGGRDCKNVVGRDSKNVIGAILNATVLKRDLKAEGFTFTHNLVRFRAYIKSSGVFFF